MSPRVEQSGSYLYTVAFISFEKRGEITTRKLNSIMAQLREQFGTEIELETSLLRYVCNHVGATIPVDHLGDISPHGFSTCKISRCN